MRASSDRIPRWRPRGLNDWVDYGAVLDSWVDRRWGRVITLYALAEPLRDQGYVAVGRRSNNAAMLRTLVLLREGDELRSLEPGTEAPVLRRRARAARRRPQPAPSDGGGPS